MVASMWGPTIVERGVLFSDAVTVSIRLSATISVWCVAAATIEAMRQALEDRAQIEQNRLEIEAAAQKALTVSLREKETLLKEVHHRVKNNLQIISSLLTMQMDQSTDPAVHRPLIESMGRVRSMALIHEQLYSSLSQARVDLGAYAKRLTRGLSRSLGQDARIEVSGDVVELPVDLAVPCGLILNELVTNALKYGLASDGTCHVSVEIANRDDGFSLTVADRGQGLPSGMDIAKTKSLGMQLVHALARQIRATIDVDDSDGTKFCLYRPDPTGTADREN
jgi:two-component sensor histidine kinase